MYSKLKSRPKIFCVSSSQYRWSAIVTFPGHTHFLANIVFFKPDKILLMAKEPEFAETIYLSKNKCSVLLHMLWTYLTYTASVKGI